MRHFRSVALALATATQLALVAASCSSSGGTASTSTSTTVSAALATATIDTVAPFDALQGNEAISQDENLTRFRQQQAEIARCMREEGWDYTPEEPYDPRTDHGQEFGTSAYGPIHGYGVVQEYEIARSGQPDTVDPNSDYIASLSEDEASRYNNDRYGVYGPDGNTIAGQEGCVQHAIDTIAGTNPIESVAGAHDRYVELVSSIGSDPELTSARQAWDGCMVAATGPLEIGARPISAPEDMNDYVASLLAVARGAVVSAYTDGGSAPVDTEGEVLANGVFWGAKGGSDSVTVEDLDAIREHELSLWATDASCRAESHVDEALVAAQQERVDQLVAEFPALATAEG